MQRGGRDRRGAENGCTGLHMAPMGNERMVRRRGFTYIELMIAVVVAAILVVAALPDEEASAKEEGRQFARKYEADVSFARSLTIARPDDPVVIKVDAANDRYWLARRSTPDTPIEHPGSKKPYIVQAGPTGPTGSKRVTINATDYHGGGAVLEFASTGETTSDTASLFQIESGNTEYEVATTSAAGESTTSDGYSKVLIPK